MKVQFDQAKREKTLQELGLDFSRAVEVFEGTHFTGKDQRQDYRRIGSSQSVG